MKKIPLTQGKFALVDDADFDWLNQWKWQYHRLGYAVRGEFGKTIRMHRQIMNAPDGIEVDHKNRNKIDNQRSNLRLATRQQNEGNKAIQTNNTSGFRGVTWDNSKKKWKAHIKINKQTKNLGRFNCPVEAAKAYNKMALTVFGEFAFLNTV